MTLLQFASKIKDFTSIRTAKQIDYFVYFLTVLQEKNGIQARDVEDCFDTLKIPKYSNISAYLSNNSKKARTKSAKFILQKGCYHLTMSKKVEFDAIFNMPVVISPSDDYLPLELFKNTRGYLESIVLQAAACYEYGLYDACSVMTRKLLEVLIIEAFERHKIATKIKDINDNFFFLSDLIDKFRNEPTWNIGRNTKECIPKLKKIGDLSAHNRRYFSKKPDVDKLKDDLRIVVEELIHIIDYTTWR